MYVTTEGLPVATFFGLSAVKTYKLRIFDRLLGNAEKCASSQEWVSISEDG